MSFVDIRVDLPSYSHTFTVKVPSSCSVSQLKQQIHQSCPGQPRPDGQRLIWRGRVLTDSENIESLWMVSATRSTERVCYLTMHIMHRPTPGLCISLFTHQLGHRLLLKLHNPRLNQRFFTSPVPPPHLHPTPIPQDRAWLHHRVRDSSCIRRLAILSFGNGICSLPASESSTCSFSLNHSSCGT